MPETTSRQCQLAINYKWISCFLAAGGAAWIAQTARLIEMPPWARALPRKLLGQATQDRSRLNMKM